MIRMIFTFTPVAIHLCRFRQELVQDPKRPHRWICFRRFGCRCQCPSAHFKFTTDLILNFIESSNQDQSHLYWLGGLRRWHLQRELLVCSICSLLVELYSTVNDSTVSSFRTLTSCGAFLPALGFAPTFVFLLRMCSTNADEFYQITLTVQAPGNTNTTQQWKLTNV